MNNKYKMDR